jgi:hypothetical protein
MHSVHNYLKSSNTVMLSVLPKLPNNKADWSNKVPEPINSRRAPRIINTMENPIPIIKPSNYQGTLLAVLPPGAFIGLGLIVALKNWIDA